MRAAARLRSGRSSMERDRPKRGRPRSQAIIRRARDVKKMSDRGYKYYQIQISKRGWRSAEPIEISNTIENPRLLKRLFSTHTDQLGYSVGALADMFGIHVEDMAEVYPIERPRLRLVT
jgi:hypothetical protein